MTETTVKHLMIAINDTVHLINLRKLFPEPYCTNLSEVIAEARRTPEKEFVVSKAMGVHASVECAKNKKYIVLHLRPLGNKAFTLYTASLYAVNVKVAGFHEAGFAAELTGGDPKRRNELEAEIRKNQLWWRTMPEAQEDA